ncbi:MAG TPA: MFS transporter [Candidatus Sulfotelmatobacter sp.]|jgi:PPP family 3-phenylpropionic acid transporter|nr:MFS transporter [Candidatus Sulfotelmatobacter sp.]
MQQRRSLAIRLSCLYAAMFSVIGVQLPFWPLYLNGKGLSPAEIGQLMAAAFFVKIVTNPLIGHVVDSRGERRHTQLALACAALVVSALFFAAQGFVPLLAVTMLTAATFTALMPLGDSLTMQSAVAHHLDYGRIRLWGSLSFIATATLGGWVLVDAPRPAILWAVIAGQAVTLWTVYRLPDTRPSRPKEGGHPSILPLLKDKRFLLFLAATSLTQVSHMIYYGFATLYWQAAGLPGWVIGGLWAEGVIAEVILFAFGNKAVARFGPVTLIAAGALAGVVRWSVLATTTAPLLLASVQFLHAFTFGATHLGAMHFINRTAPPGLSGRAQGIYASVANGVVPGAAMLAAGRLYQGFGGLSFLGMTVVAAAGLAIAVKLKRSAA